MSGESFGVTGASSGIDVGRLWTAVWEILTVF